MEAAWLVDLWSIVSELFPTHQFQSIAYHFHFDVSVDFTWFLLKTFFTLFRHQNVQRGVVINLKYPSLQLFVNEDVKAEDLEAVTFPLIKSALEEWVLLEDTSRLERDQRLLTNLYDLLEKIVSVYAMLSL